MKSRSFTVYIVSNYLRTVLYTGVTNNIVRRVQEHRSKENKGFTARYNCHYLVYYEEYADVRNAIAREKQLKRWHREWKFNLIREQNPEMKDLAEEWLG